MKPTKPILVKIPGSVFRINYAISVNALLRGADPFLEIKESDLWNRIWFFVIE